MPASTSASASKHRIGYARLLVTAIVLLALDQLTKAWVFNNLDLGSYFYPDYIEIIPGFFNIVHIGNEGAAWGLFSGYGEWLALLALVALFAIFRYRHSLELHSSSRQYIFGLIVGGVLGNLVDRLLHGHVIDFLDFHLPFSIPGILTDGRWPAFNLADSGIVVGVIAYVALSFLDPEPERPGEKNTEN
ncbi:MAG: signal peptidase II [Opitutales bacterium]